MPMCSFMRVGAVSMLCAAACGLFVFYVLG
jgi:hypothetical protein